MIPIYLDSIIPFCYRKPLFFFQKTWQCLVNFVGSTMLSTPGMINSTAISSHSPAWREHVKALCRTKQGNSLPEHATAPEVSETSSHELPSPLQCCNVANLWCFTKHLLQWLGFAKSMPFSKHSIQKYPKALNFKLLLCCWIHVL